jgi:hypothetical protein
MAEKFGIINCDLCLREYKKYVPKEISRIYGISVFRNKEYSQLIKFVNVDKSEVNKHICTFCISDIVNKFGI